jgi:hypothetical protein
MAAFGVRIACYTHGVTFVTLNFAGKRSGSNNDNMEMRVVRRRSGYGDTILPGTAIFSLLADTTGRAWQWVDADVPANGEWDYVLQVRRLDGGGSLQQMLLTAIHSKR